MSTLNDVTEPQSLQYSNTGGSVLSHPIQGDKAAHFVRTGNDNGVGRPGNIDQKPIRVGKQRAFLFNFEGLCVYGWLAQPG